ncbi:MAG: hypothetical protein C0P66_012835 [Bacillaceae bacterium]
MGLLFFAGKGDCEEWNGPQKRNRRFFVGVFQLQHRRPRNGGFGLASGFRLRLFAHGHIGRFSVAFMSATLALAARGMFRKQRFFEKAVPVRHIFGDARIHLMRVRGQFCDAIVREG